MSGLQNTRSTIQMYKDLYRVAQHMGARQKNTRELCAMVTGEFRKNMYETDPERIQKYRDDCARVISNYMGLLALNEVSSRKK